MTSLYELASFKKNIQLIINLLRIILKNINNLFLYVKKNYKFATQ